MKIEWSPDLETGNDNIDSQHKQLIAYLNDLLDACVKGSDIDALSGNLNFLVNYAVRHFCDEEETQQKYGYPDYQNHKRMHESFKQTAEALMRDFEENGSSAELSKALYDTVAMWFIQHISREDKKIGEHIRHLEREGDEFDA